MARGCKQAYLLYTYHMPIVLLRNGTSSAVELTEDDIFGASTC